MKLIVKPVAIHLAFLSAIAFADNADFRMTTLSSFTTAYSLAIDQTDGSIYIWGQASSDMILLKMRANGTIAWQSYYEASGATLSAGDVTGISPVIDPQSGDIFVHGRTTGVIDGQRALKPSVWDAAFEPSRTVWQALAHAPELNNLIVAVSSNLVGQGAATSYDGLNWTLQTTPGTVRWRDIAWSPQLLLFAAVSQSNTIMTSSNGFNWTARTSPGTQANSWSSICWSAELSLFVAVASSASAPSNQRVMVSADGIVWSIQTVADEMNVALNDVQWSKELSSFLISGQGSFFTSPNGYNWTRQAAPSSSSWSSAVWVPERNSWTALTSNNGLNGAAISANGSSWNIQRLATPEANLNLAWSPVLKIFISVGVWVFPSMSSDGVSWYENTDGVSKSWGSVIWVPSLGQFVGVSRESGESFRLLSAKTLSEGAFVSRFNAQNGTRYWTRVYTQPRLCVFNVRPTATVMSANNVLYLGGYSTGDFNDAIAPNTVSKAYLVAMNPNNGSVLWTRIWGSSGATQLYSMDLDVGRQFLYTAGSTIGSIDGVKTAKSGSDVFICEHRASNGTINNCWQFGTAGDDFAYSILVENNQGTILVAGSTNGFFNNNILASSTDVLLVRFNATSGQIVENLSFPNDGSDAFLSLTRDNETGNIFCTGYVSAWSQPLNLRQTYGAGRDILLASFYPNMTIRFMRLAGSPLVETGFSLVYYRSAQQLLIASDYNRRGTLLNFSLPLEPAAVTTTSTATGNSATTSTVSVKTLLTSASTTSSSVSEPRYSSTPTIADPTTPSTAPIGADFTSIFSSPSFIIGIAVLGAILVSIMIGMAILVKRVSYLRRKSMAYEKLDRSYSVGQGFSSHAKQAASGLGTFAMMSPFSEDIYPRKFPTNSVTAEPTVNLTLRGSETTSDFTQSLEQQYSTQTVTF